MAILGDAIRVLNELKTESEEYKEMNQKLMEEIKTLKVRYDFPAVNGTGKVERLK